jgi:DNA-binding beta-propeller fold protein YncE
MRNKGLYLLGLIVLIGALGLSAKSGAPTLKKVTEFDLPGPPGRRFDYLTITPDDHYLLSTHLAAGQMYVIDLRRNKVMATVLDTPGAEGVEYVPELKKAYTSNAGDNTIGVVDLRQMKVIQKLPTEAKPDGSAYASPFHKLYVSDERGKAEAIVDVHRQYRQNASLRQRNGNAAVRSRRPEGVRQPPGQEYSCGHRSGH